MNTKLTQEQKQGLNNIKQILKNEQQKAMQEQKNILYFDLELLKTIQKEIYTDTSDFIDFAKMHYNYNFEYNQINNNYFIKIASGVYQLYFKEQKAITKKQKLFADTFIKIYKIEKIF